MTPLLGKLNDTIETIRIETNANTLIEKIQSSLLGLPPLL
jgi:hypothetical protein